MRTLLTTFATPEFGPSLEELRRTAILGGVDEVDGWHPDRLRATAFYTRNRRILDQRRGAGYWLWKPFIVLEALLSARDDDLIIYADAGISITGTLAPLLKFCAEREILICAAHYEYGGIPDACRHWTKRDCFVLARCDSADYHSAPMVDGAFLVFRRTKRSIQFVREWLESCSDSRVLTDAPNECGLDNLPQYVSHRHDQSVLALAAAKWGLELFRSPSQFGNHLKPTALREHGEWTARPYGSSPIYDNSPYPTLLFHHRRRMLSLPTSRRRPCRLLQATAVPDDDVRQLCPGWRDAERTVLEGSPHLRLAARDWQSFAGTRFDVIVSDALSVEDILAEAEQIAIHGVGHDAQFTLCWASLDGMDGWRAFRDARKPLVCLFPSSRATIQYGCLQHLNEAETRTVGIVHVEGRVSAPDQADE
jgi:hypothetical protein